MKELFETAIAYYDNCRGTGKLLVLFVAAVLIIYLIQKKVLPGGFNPAVFLLSFYTGIAYAFTLIYEASGKALKLTGPADAGKGAGDPAMAAEGSGDVARDSAAGAEGSKDKARDPAMAVGRSGGKGRKEGARTGLYKRVLLNVLVSGLLVVACILGGKRVIAGEFYEPKENALHLKTRHVMVMDRLLELSEEESIVTVIATPQISPYLRQYSSKFMPLYDCPPNGEALRLSEGARIVYNEFSVSTPRMDKITAVGHKEGYDYLLVDTKRYYPELKASEFGYELLDTVDGFEIYRSGGDL